MRIMQIAHAAELGGTDKDTVIMESGCLFMSSLSRAISNR
jgi:hypothetical protein